MAQRLARSYFFYHSVFSTSKAFNRMTSSVKAVPTRLPLKPFSQRISFSLIPPSFSSLLCNIDSTLQPWQLQKRGEKKINHCLSQTGSCNAHDKVIRTMIYFISAIAVIDMLILARFPTQKIQTRRTDWISNPPDGLIDWSFLTNICSDLLE